MPGCFLAAPCPRASSDSPSPSWTVPRRPASSHRGEGQCILRGLDSACRRDRPGQARGRRSGLPSAGTAATLPCLGPARAPSGGRPLSHLPAPQMVKPPIHCSPEHFDGGHKECGAWRQEVLASVGGGLCQSQACPPDRETEAVVPPYLSRLTEPPCSMALTSLGLCRRQGCRRLCQQRNGQMVPDDGGGSCCSRPGLPSTWLHCSAHSCTINTHTRSHPRGCLTSSMCALACIYVATQLPNKCTRGA